jgi:ketosteroid isomerase-like protein
MTTTTEGTSRTAHLLALMKKGEDALNARDFAAVDEIHHPDMVAYIPGLAKPVYGREAHAAAMQQRFSLVGRRRRRSARRLAERIDAGVQGRL